MSVQNWDALPADLKYVQQWCISAPDKSPYSTTGHRASVIDAMHWTDWYSASTIAASWGTGAGIGFVLTQDDEFTCIDLDVKDGTTEEELERYQKIIEAFDSYTERSTSGRGYHIWIRGKIGAGCRREGVEVYSQQRFIICTGNIVRDKPVERRQEVLDMLVADLRRLQQDTNALPLFEIPEVDTDVVILERALEASNGAKFNELWLGEWQSNTAFPSQSEADLALLSMLTFYSPSNAQVRRMFRASGLGKREKAVKNDKYLDRTLGVIRDRQAREEEVRAHGETVAIQLVTRTLASTKPKLLPVVGDTSTLPWPPGPVGALAQWLFRVAPRPVREVAIITALGVFAGAYGRAYNISNSGLNLYLVLVARSAVGKEAIHSGASRIVNTLMNNGIPAIGQSVDFADYASGPALVKALADRGSFCNIAGEWGRKLRAMSDDTKEGPMSSLRTVMTNLYQKSSAGTIVGGIGYSNKEKDIKSTDGVAFSMIGETTPATFYESLTNTMMQDGFMSRFIVVEYTGLRPPLNTMMNETVPDWFVNMMGNFFQHSAQLLPGKFFDVPVDHTAQKMLDDFNVECDEHINETEDESWRQMWNRAHLKTLKVSALLAVANNFMNPLVTQAEAEWALELIRRDIRIMSRKMSDGDVGDGDMVRERKIISVIQAYFTVGPIPPGYKLSDDMRLKGVVARKYLQSKTQNVNSFAKSKLGQNAELDRTVKSLMDSGYLIEVARDKIPKDWGPCGRCYRVLTLPDN